MGLNTSLPMTICVAGLALGGQAVQAVQIKCWQNKQNIRECSETVPPEYSQQRIEVLNEQGLVIRVIEPRKTQHQLEAEARQAKAQQLREEQRRKDLILLKTFTTEQDLVLSRDKNISAIDGAIAIANSNLRLLNKNLAKLQKRAANYERAGRHVPDHLLEDMAAIKSQIEENEKYVADQTGKKQALEEQFAADLTRYRQLKRVKPR